MPVLDPFGVRSVERQQAIDIAGNEGFAERSEVERAHLATIPGTAQLGEGSTALSLCAEAVA